MNKQTIARVIALALAVILALGCFLTPVLAAEATAEAEEAAGMPVLPILLSAAFGAGAAVVMMMKNKRK